MKKDIFCLIFLAFFFGNNIIAQDKPFLFGIKVAPNIGWMNSGSEGYDNDGVKTGFSWGVITQFHLMENYDLHSGINVSILRSTLTYPDLKTIESEQIPGNLYRAYNLKYLGIPLVFRMKTNEFTKRKFFGQIGAQLNFLLSAMGKDKFNSQDAGQINEENNIYDEIKFTKYSMIFGAGIEYQLGGSNVLISGINFNNGINDILKDQNKIDPTIRQIAKINYIELYLSMLF
ncbi:MAG: PorT family protein [Bacteroidetes bacterium]|nr:PorT family protein [Bacteroidota bacterium]